MPERLLLLVAVLAFTAVAGALVRSFERREERRGFDTVEHAGPGQAPVAVRVLPAPPPGGAVVVLGTRACATCARTAALLRRAAADTEVEVAHLLLEDRPDLADALHVRTAPTVLVLDQAGEVTGRHDGGLDPAGAGAAIAAAAAPRATGGAVTGGVTDGVTAAGGER